MGKFFFESFGVIGSLVPPNRARAIFSLSVSSLGTIGTTSERGSADCDAKEVEFEVVEFTDRYDPITGPGGTGTGTGTGSFFLPQI